MTNKVVYYAQWSITLHDENQKKQLSLKKCRSYLITYCSKVSKPTWNQKMKIKIDLSILNCNYITIIYTVSGKKEYSFLCIV